MAKPLVSVVIPAYNHERFIGYTLQSVLDQTIQDFEIIVVNDGSTDGTEDVVKGYRDPRIRYYYQENQDAFNTLNRGISLAEGHYIAVLNSDDVYHRQRLEKMDSYCRENDKVCAISDVVAIDETNGEFTDPKFGWNVWHQGNRDFYFGCRDLYTAFLHGNFMVTTSNLFMTTEAARKIGTFCSLRYLHDYDFIFRMVEEYNDRVGYLHDEKLLSYRIHSGNTLGEAAITGREQDMALIEKYMLRAVPEQFRAQVKTGSDRLVDLQRELNHVRRQIQPQEPTGVRPAVKNLREALKTWFVKKFSGRHRR